MCLCKNSIVNDDIPCTCVRPRQFCLLYVCWSVTAVLSAELVCELVSAEPIAPTCRGLVSGHGTAFSVISAGGAGGSWLGPAKVIRSIPRIPILRRGSNGADSESWHQSARHPSILVTVQLNLPAYDKPDIASDSTV